MQDQKFVVTKSDDVDLVLSEQDTKSEKAFIVLSEQSAEFIANKSEDVNLVLRLMYGTFRS